MPEEIKPKEDNVLDQPLQEAAIVAEELEKKDEGIPSDADLEKIAKTDHSEAVASAEAIHPEVSSEVFDAGIKTHHEGQLAQEVIDEHPDGTVTPTGEHHPVHTVTGKNVTLPTEPDAVFPPVMKTGEYANGDTKPLEEVTHSRWSLLRFAKLPRILGGKKAA